MTNTSGESPQPVSRSWMPTTAGILSIIAGAIDVIIGIVVAGVSEIVSWGAGFFGLGIIGVPLIALGVVAIIGGYFALRRRVWGMALAGAICALIWPLSILGILATIFVALSKQEFK